MLEKYKDRACTYFAIDYDLLLGSRLLDAAEVVSAEYRPARTGFGTSHFYDFQWPAELWRCLVGPKRIAIETLGSSPWLDHLDSRANLLLKLLEKLRVEAIKRIGFKVVVFIPLQMTHREATELFVSNFLNESEQLSAIFGKKLDPELHIEGDLDEFRYSLNLDVMTEEETSRRFLELNNLETFLNEKLLDDRVKRFHDRITERTCLFFDVDLYRNDLTAPDVKSFAKNAIESAGELAANLVRQLKSELPAES